jgi:hypothetical protein
VKLLNDPAFPVPCTIAEYSEEEMVEIALIENLQREDLNPIEEARGLARALQLPGLSQKALAEKLGLSQPWISNRIRLLELPDEILALVESGRITATFARDQLMRFMAVPDPYRAPLFAAIAAALRMPNEDLADEAEDVAYATALEHSRSLSFGGWGTDVPVFGPRRHAKCDCGAPEIDFGGYRGKVKRCWNVAWWNAEQKRAKADKRKREKKAQEKGAKPKGELGGFPVAGEDAFHKRYGSSWEQTRKFDVIADGAGCFLNRDGVYLDPADLDRESLVVIDNRYRPGDYTLASTDRAGVEAARKKFTAAFEAQLEVETPKRAQQDLEIVRSGSAAGWRDPAIIVRALLGWRERGDLDDLARELGFKPTGRDWHDTPLQGLTAEQLLDTVHVAVLRSQRHDRNEILTTHDVLLEEMAAPLREALRQLVPWEITSDAEAGDDEVVEADDVEAYGAECCVCGCTDSMACPEGCSWLAVDHEKSIGVCSSCAASEEEAQKLLADTLSILEKTALLADDLVPA